MQVFKDFLVWAWPSHGFGKEMQERALPELASRPLLRGAARAASRQPGQASSQPRPCPDPLAIFNCFHFNQMKKMKKMNKMKKHAGF